MSFPDAFRRTIIHEGTGPAAAHPDDPGGLTKYGISRRAYPDLDIEHLTLDQAREIYRRDWWDAMRLGELPERIAFAVFDAAVNSGRRQAALWLQRSLGILADGVIGPVAIAAARVADPALIAARINGHRLRHMADLSTWPAFGRGWARRIASNLIGS